MSPIGLPFDARELRDMSEVTPSIKPTSENDWTINSINIHGIFFERLCQKSIFDHVQWKLKSTNYPVEFPPPNGPFRGKESSLDIRAELKKSDRVFTLLIECKKNNPELVNWIFFPKYFKPETSSVGLYQMTNKARSDSPGHWSTDTSLKTLNARHIQIPVADEARETRGSYLGYKGGSITKTSSSAIQEAAHQVGLATMSIFKEDEEFSNVLGKTNPPQPMPWSKQILLPTIITSAHLFTCTFDPADVNAGTGEIPYGKAQLTEVTHLFYEYPLPRHLQSKPRDLVQALSGNHIEDFMRMHIMVVHSGALRGVLDVLAGEEDIFFA